MAELASRAAGTGSVEDPKVKPPSLHAAGAPDPELESGSGTVRLAEHCWYSFSATTATVPRHASTPPPYQRKEAPWFVQAISFAFTFWPPGSFELVQAAAVAAGPGRASVRSQRNAGCSLGATCASETLKRRALTAGAAATLIGDMWKNEEVTDGGAPAAAPAEPSTTRHANPRRPAVLAAKLTTPSSRTRPHTVTAARREAEPDTARWFTRSRSPACPAYAAPGDR